MFFLSKIFRSRHDISEGVSKLINEATLLTNYNLQ